MRTDRTIRTDWARNTEKRCSVPVSVSANCSVSAHCALAAVVESKTNSQKKTPADFPAGVHLLPIEAYPINGLFCFSALGSGKHVCVP